MSSLRQRRRGGDDDDAPVERASKPKLKLESFDLYQKVAVEEQVKTTSGATVSIFAIVICAVLILYEFSGWLFPTRYEQVAVDPVIDGKLQINIDITFHALSCAAANLDAMDVAGEQQNGIDTNLSKTRLSPSGKPIGDAYMVATPDPGALVAAETPLPDDYCGPCYGAEIQEGQCCNTCDEVRGAYAERGWDSTEVTKTSEQCIRARRNRPTVLGEEGEGCRLKGTMLVNKVSGNFHVAMGETHTRGAGHIHQFSPGQMLTFNVSHTIHHMSFGKPFPGMRNPLDGTSKIMGPPTEAGSSASGVQMYYVKVIPTVYKGLVTNQYSITSQFRPAVVHGQRQNVLPGVFFVYDLSPFMVTVTEAPTPLGQVITSTFAILGGVLTIARVIDAALYRAQKAMKPGGEGTAFGALLAAVARIVAPEGGSSGGALASPAAAMALFKGAAGPDASKLGGGPLSQ